MVQVFSDVMKHALSASTLPIALQRQDDHALSASTLPIALQRQDDHVLSIT